jgi:hypothetical protein
MTPNQAATVLLEADVKPKWRGPAIVPDEILWVGDGLHVTVFRVAQPCRWCKGTGESHCECDIHVKAGCDLCKGSKTRGRLDYWGDGETESMIPYADPLPSEIELTANSGISITVEGFSL